MPGRACEFLNTCPIGEACIDADALPQCEGSTGCCSPICALDAPDLCDTILPGTVCTPWFEEEPSGCTPTGIGICAAPE